MIIVDFQKFSPVSRRDLQETFENFGLFICFAHNVNIWQMFWWITNHSRSLITCIAREREKSVYRSLAIELNFTIVRLRFVIGIRHAADEAIRCRWRIMNAKVSRFGLGNCWIRESNLCCLERSYSSSTRLANVFHNWSVNSDSDSERRKSLTTPQMRCISFDDRSNRPERDLSKRSLRSLTWLSTLNDAMFWGKGSEGE